MRLELQMKNLPVVWPAFLIFLAVFLGGFAYAGGGLAAALLVGALAVALAAYAGAFAEPADRVRLRQFAASAAKGDLTFDAAKPAFIRKAVEERMDPLLFRWSYDYVGDLAETVALVWPARPGANREPELSEVIDALRGATRAEVQRLIEGWLDAMQPTGRWALLKLMTGGLRVGVSSRLAKQAAADLGGVAINEVEEVWHALHPPYEDLFAWLEGRSDRPRPDSPGRFRPTMLAQALGDLRVPGRG